MRQQLADQRQRLNEVENGRNEREQSAATEKQLVKYTRWLVYVGAIQFFALIFQALIFFLTLKKIEAQANLMREHAKHLENLATAAGDNAIAAKANVDALISSERAWILIDTGEIPDDFAADPSSVAFLNVRPLLRNSGKTPGWIKRGFINTLLIPSGTQIPPEPNYLGGSSELPVNIIVPPNGYIQALEVRVPVSTFVNVRQGSQKLFVYGFIEYSDFAKQKGQTRESRFCIEYHVPAGFDPQPRGFYMAVDVPIAYTHCS